MIYILAYYLIDILSDYKNNYLFLNYILIIKLI